MISPMKVIRLLIGILIYWNSSVAQFVRLENQQFKIGNDNFFPMCMNYTIEDVKNGNSFFPAPCHSYGNNNMNLPDILECDNLTDCKQQLQQHFNYIAGMGFNVIRLCELSPKIKIHISPINNLEAYSINHEYVDISSSTDFVDIIQIPQISESEQGIQILLSELDVILECAANTVLPNTGVSHPMKIILLNEYTSLLTDNEVSFRAAYLKVLSKHIRNSPFRNSFFAHDLMNEPAPNLKPRKTKQKACEIIDSWYTAIKGEDPTQLVTLGTGIDDVFSFDPAIIHVDFLSLHVYPNWDRESDNHYDPAAQQRMRTRMINEIYYFDKICPKPWIIGETGFKADDYSSFSSPPTPPPPGQVPTIPSAIPTTTSLTKMGYDGSLIDLGKFVNNSLYDACNCGAKGYSWWWFQETTFGDMAGDSYGLLRLNWDPNNTNYGSSIEKQPAVNNFRSFANAMPSNNNLPIFGGQCGTDYTPSYSSNSMYYNPYLNSADPNFELTATITGNNGNLVDNALVFVNPVFEISDPTSSTIPPDIIIINENYYTHSSVNGIVKITPKTPINYISGQIGQVDISTPNGSVKEYCNWCLNTNNPVPQSDFTLSLNEELSDVTISNQLFINTSNFFSGVNLVINNSSISGISNANFAAEKTITINSEFEVTNQNECRFYISPFVDECSELPENMNNRFASIQFKNSKALSKSKHKIELIFEPQDLILFPNPSVDYVKIYYSKESLGSNNTLSITDLNGKVIVDNLVFQNQFELDVRKYSKGLYFVKIVKGEKSFFKKLIIGEL